MAMLNKGLKDAVGPGGAFSLTLLNVGATDFKEAAKKGGNGLTPALARLLQGSQGAATQLAAAPASGMAPLCINRAMHTADLFPAVSEGAGECAKRPLSAWSYGTLLGTCLQEILDCAGPLLCG